MEKVKKMTLNKTLWLTFFVLCMVYYYPISALNVDIPSPPTNYSLVNVNNSQFLEGHPASYFYPASNPNGFISDLSGYVPYTGATATVELGAHTLQASGVETSIVYAESDATTNIAPSGGTITMVADGHNLIGLNTPLDNQLTFGEFNTPTDIDLSFYGNGGEILTYDYGVNKWTSSSPTDAYANYKIFDGANLIIGSNNNSLLWHQPTGLTGLHIDADSYSTNERLFLDTATVVTPTASAQFGFSSAHTFTGTTGTPQEMGGTITITPTANSAYTLIAGLSGGLTFSNADKNITVSNIIRGMTGVTSIQTTGTTGNISGGISNVYSRLNADGSKFTGTLDAFKFFDTTWNVVSNPKITQLWGLKISPMTSSTTNIVNITGIEVGDISGASDRNYAIKTGLGNVSFGDDVYIYNANLYINGTLNYFSPEIKCYDNSWCAYSYADERGVVTGSFQMDDNWNIISPTRDLPVEVIDKMTSIKRTEESKASYRTLDKTCPEYHTFTTYEEYKSGITARCNYKEELKILECEEKSFQYWDSGSKSCRTNPYLKCSEDSTKYWDYGTKKCLVDEKAVCNQGATTEWIGGACATSATKVEQKEISDCYASGRDKYYDTNTRMCISAKGI